MTATETFLLELNIACGSSWTPRQEICVQQKTASSGASSFLLIERRGSNFLSTSQQVQYELNVERNKAVGLQAREEMSIAANKLMVQDFWPFLV